MARVRSYDTMGILVNGMGYSALRHQILSDNIANIDTPGFKRSDVAFENELQAALSDEPKLEMKRSSGRHIASEWTKPAESVHPKVFSELDTWTRNDKNNVDPEVEMVNIAKNTMYYNALANRIAGKFRGLSKVLQNTPSS